MIEFSCITHNLDLFDGKPCVRHLPITAASILEMLASGCSQADILKKFPALRPDDINHTLHYAAWRIDQTAAMHPPPRPVDAVKPLPSTPPNLAPNPPVVLTRVGIFDRRMEIGIIAWHDIENMTVSHHLGVETVDLEVISPGRYFDRMPPLQRQIAKARLALRINPFRLRAEGSGFGGDDLFAWVKRNWLVYRSDKWAPPQDVPEFSSLLQKKTQGESPASNHAL